MQVQFIFNIFFLGVILSSCAHFNQPANTRSGIVQKSIEKNGTDWPNEEQTFFNPCSGNPSYKVKHLLTKQGYAIENFEGLNWAYKDKEQNSSKKYLLQGHCFCQEVR